MKILVVGSGGREHALVWKLKSSPLVEQIYAAPGSDGIGFMGTSVDIKADDIEGLAKFALDNNIDLTVVGPEVPLTLGIVDYFENKKLRIFGPSKKAAQIEGSKSFSKEFMRKYHIPTASFKVFGEAGEATDFSRGAAYPLFIKASGLAAGKGAVRADNIDEALETIDRIMKQKIFGEAGNEIVIEECMTGPEVTVMAFSDGKTILPMVSSQDHKQIFDGDKGPNTGGMGAYAPTNIVDEGMLEIIREHILEPAIRGMEKEGCPYKGVLYAGLMITSVGPRVIEFNCRFGDPETQTVLPLLHSDLVEIMTACIDGNLKDITPVWKDKAAVCVVMASAGYPAGSDKGKPITGVRSYRENHAYLFHSGTRKEGDGWITAGGRVLGITAVQNDIKSAQAAAYETIKCIEFEGAQFRRDIAYQAL